SIRISALIELGPPPRPLGGAHSLRPSPADEALDPLPRLDVGSPRCRPLETSVDGLTDQIGFRDAVPAGAFLEQTVLAGLDVNLLASHSWHPPHLRLWSYIVTYIVRSNAIRYGHRATRGALASGRGAARSARRKSASPRTVAAMTSAAKTMGAAGLPTTSRTTPAASHQHRGAEGDDGDETRVEAAPGEARAQREPDLSPWKPRAARRWPGRAPLRARRIAIREGDEHEPEGGGDRRGRDGHPPRGG